MDSIWVILIIMAIFNAINKTIKGKTENKSQQAKTPQQIEAERRRAEALRRGEGQKSLAEERMETERQAEGRGNRLSKEERIERQIERAKRREAEQGKAVEARRRKGAKPYAAPAPAADAPRPKAVPVNSLEDFLRHLKEEAQKEMGLPMDEPDAAPVYESPVLEYEEERAAVPGIHLDAGSLHYGEASIYQEGGQEELYNDSSLMPLSELVAKSASAKAPKDEIKIKSRGLSREDLLNGIVMREILGPPKALRKAGSRSFYK